MPSANDNFASRTTLTPVSGGSASFDNTGNTLETNEPNPGTGQLKRTGWYKITPTDRRIFRFRVTALPHASARVRLEFYKGTALLNMITTRLTTYWGQQDGGDSTRFAPSNANIGWVTATVNTWYEFQLPAGEIQVQVGVEDLAHQGTISFEWEELTPPANDDWADAIEITDPALPGTESGTTEGATWDTALATDDAWPLYIAPGTFWRWTELLRGAAWYMITSFSTHTYRFTLEPTSSAEDMRFVVLTGDTYPTLVNQGWGRPDEPIDVQLNAGVQYWIAVAALNLGSTSTNDQSRWRGPFDLSWERIDQPANDDWENAEVVSGDTGSSTNTDMDGATTEDDEPEKSFFPQNDFGSVWWTYTPTTSGLYELTTGSSTTANASSELRVFQGSDLVSLQTLTYDSEGLSGSPFSLLVGLRAGETYSVRFKTGANYHFYSALTDTDYGGFGWDLQTAAPANDDWADAELITGSSGTVSGDNSAATFENGEYGRFYDDSYPYGTSRFPTVWYEWVAPTADVYRFRAFDPASSGDLDFGLTIFTGTTLETLTPVVENEDGALPGVNFSYDALLGLEAEIGVTYWIRVGSFNWDYAGAFDLEWDVETAPANDDFANATLLAATTSGGPTTYDNLAADPLAEPDEPDAATETGETEVLYGRSVWFKWVPPTTSTYEFTIDNPGFAAHWMLYEAAALPDIATLTLLGEENIEYDVASIEFSADSTKTYYIRFIGSANFNAAGGPDLTKTYALGQGEFIISWLRVPTPPDNDDLSAALDDDPANPANLVSFGDPERWRPSGGCVQATTLDATAQAGEVSVAGFGPTRTVWFYWWSADFTGTMRFWTESSEVTDLVMAVYEGIPFNPPSAPGTLLDSDDDSGPGLMPECQFTATPLEAYLIQVDCKDNPGGEFTLHWTRVTASPPVNDDFADAIELDMSGEGPFTLSGTTVDATVECDEPAQDFEGPFGSVWYHVMSPVDRGIQITLKATSDANDSGIKAILYRSNSPLSELEDATDGFYPWVFDLDEEETVAYQLAAGVDYYISVSNYFEDAGPGGAGATFDVTHELSSLTPGDGDPFETPIDSSPSAPGGQVLAGTTEGNTTQPGEPAVDDIAGTTWHKFIPDHDGIYIFQVEADNGDDLWFDVWQGTSLSSLKAIPGYWTDFTNKLTNDPRVLRGGETYYVRVKRFTGDTWGEYTLNITSYPEYDDWASADAGYDSITGSGSYDSLNDQLTFTGAGSAVVDPWLDVDDNPQNAGRRWIQIRFKMRVTEGVTMYRAGYTNYLGVVRGLDPDGDPVWELVITGNVEGTNTLAVRDPDDGDTRIMFHPADFGTREREFNEWADVEVVLRADAGRHTVPTTYSTDVAVNGVKKRYVENHQEDGVQATIPFRSLEFGAFHYPSSYNSTLSSLSTPYGDPHDDWEIQIKDVVVRNRPTLGMLPSTDEGDLGVVAFDGWEHENALDNVNAFPYQTGATIVDAPGTPPGNADWWKSVRILNASGTNYPLGSIHHSWLHTVRPWVGFWLYLEEFPEITDDLNLVISYFPHVYSNYVNGFGALMINGEGELRVAPQMSERVWNSYCVARLETGSWYWVEMELDLSVMHDASAEISINGVQMGTFEFDPRDLEGFDLNNFPYAGVPTSIFPISWLLGPLFTTSNSTFAPWTPWNTYGTTIDMHYAHTCMGRAVDFPLNAMQTKLFGGIDEDGTHNFPELPAYPDHEHLWKADETAGVDRYWTIYNFDDETDTDDPAVSGTAPGEFHWRTPGGGTIDVIADGGGHAEIAAYNAVRWAPRATIPDSPYGTKHFPLFGYGPRQVYAAPEGGLTGHNLVFMAWARGDGYLQFANYVSANDAVPWGTVRTLGGTYIQFWGAVHPAWHPSVVTASAQIESVWDSNPLILTDRMYWKRARVLGNPESYPRFAISTDGGATWTMLEDPAVTTTHNSIGSDVTVSDGNAVFLNNTSAIKRLMEHKEGPTSGGLHSVGYEATEWYLEYISVPSVEIEEAEEFGGTRGYNLHVRHAGYDGPPETARAEGDIYIVLADDTHQAPHHKITATASKISRVRYPTDCSGGHWTTSVFGDTRLRFGYYRAMTSQTYWATSQNRGGILEAVQWEVLSQAAPGPAPTPCRHRPQIYRLVYY